MGLMQLLTVEEAATILKTSPQQVRKMIALELLPAVKIGREWRISAKYLEEFLEEGMK